MRPVDEIAPGSTVSVMVPVAVDGPYSYQVGEQPVRLGSLVQVPLGPRKVAGVVWDDPPGDVPANKLRAIEHVFPTAPLDHDLRRFVDWVADYTLSPRGMIMRMILRAPAAFEPEAGMPAFVRGEGEPERLTDARRRVLDLMSDGFARRKAEIVAESGVSASVIDGLAKVSALMPVTLAPPKAGELLDPDYNPPTLSAEQQDVVANLIAAVDDNAYFVGLLDGVTGSGKTEVYLEAVARSVAAGRQVLVLLPEIALTAQLMDRFATRFGARPLEWHSDVSPKQRERTWRAVNSGEAQVVVGARSALFLPFRNLGLIVVDEEHEAAFKQIDRATYNARDMAIVRAHLAGFPIVLASATPSVDSYHNALSGRYQWLRLPHRFGGADLAELSLVDMRKAGPPAGKWLAPVLVEAIRQSLDKQEQSLLFLNRRGYAPLTLCRSCGHRFQCPDCTAWLVEHRFRGVLSCHHCGHTIHRPEQCPSCGDVDSLVPCGPGVERIAEEAAEQFEGARIMLLSSDMFSTTERLREELSIIADHGCDIVIGTQVVAKGHHFPDMKTVGVIDADIGLSHGDPRAAERTFQLIAQVTGRAGRIGGGGRGFIQTYCPDHPVMHALLASDRDAFYDAELAGREAAQMPPFGKLAAIVISAGDRQSAFAFAGEMARRAPPADRLSVLGPADAPMAVIRGRHRIRLLVHGDKKVNMQSFLRAWLARCDPPRGDLRVAVDVDPTTFY